MLQSLRPQPRHPHITSCRSVSLPRLPSNQVCVSAVDPALFLPAVAAGAHMVRHTRRKLVTSKRMIGFHDRLACSASAAFFALCVTEAQLPLNPNLRLPIWESQSVLCAHSVCCDCTLSASFPLSPSPSNRSFHSHPSLPLSPPTQIEIGNFDSFYPQGKFFSADDVSE